MNDEELQRLRDEVRRKRTEKLNSAADLDATAADAILPPSPAATSRIVKLWRRIMPKPKLVTVAQLRRNAASQTANLPAVSDATSLAVQSPTNVRGFDKPAPVDVDWRPVAETQPATSRSWILGLTSGAIGLAFTGVGLTIGWRTASSTAIGLDGYLLAIVGLCIDAGAVIGLSISTALWRSRHWPTSIVFFVGWLGCITISTIQTSGFASRAFGDAAASRGAQIETSGDLRQQRTTAIKIATDAAKLAKTRAEKRDANVQLAQANAAPVVSVAPISAADPGPHMLADLLGISEGLIQRIRLGGFAIAPIILASLFLMASTMLLARR